MTFSSTLPPAPPPAATSFPSAPAPRQPVSIERLPNRRQAGEPRESMNCKSCRKRKIKCNRVRPSCEACRVFQCPCIYDAVPKKRGPKTDVLEALLKRVDGLEAKLKEKNNQAQTPKVGESVTVEGGEDGDDESGHAARSMQSEASSQAPQDGSLGTGIGPAPLRESSYPPVDNDTFLHAYFTRCHGKPYFILDESSIRRRMQLHELPDFLFNAIRAVAARHISHPTNPRAAVQLGLDYAMRSRASLNTDEPSIECLQALLLLVAAFIAAGQGKKAYMLLTSAIGMTMALELHRELDAREQVSPVDREMRRRLFWTCYILDRFLACGSKRSSLIGDCSVALRLPSWCPPSSSVAIVGEFFQQRSSLQYHQGGGKSSQGNTGLLIDVTRILGKTNKYLAAGGVKGDSHFPWHSLSTLSKIRQELDCWASGAETVFSALHALFQQSEATVVFLSRLIYHLVHCLLYRPFLPIDLAELAGIGHHQSWQIEATNMCFLHANAICELVDAARQAGAVEWPAIVGYCICTAATVHIHGAHYSGAGGIHGEEANVFVASSDMLSREMQRLNDLQSAWPNVRQQAVTLQGIYGAHGDLVRTMAASSSRQSPGFHLEDFFDRYANIGGPGGKSYRFDPAHLSMSDVVVDFSAARYGALSGSPDAMACEQQTQVHGEVLIPYEGAEGSGNLAQEQQQSVMNLEQVPASDGARYEVPVMQLPSHASQIPMGQGLPSDSHPGDNEGLKASPATHATSRVNQGLMAMGGAGFNPDLSYAAGSHTGEQAQVYSNDAGNNFGALFSSLGTDAFGNTSGWQADSANACQGTDIAVDGSAAQPGTATSSTMASQSEENDPFLNLLEQLAKDEQRFTSTGSDFDFFLGANAQDAQ